MNNDADNQLEALIHQKLRELPDLQAPTALLHSVMSRLRSEDRNYWWQQPWWAWPLTARLAAVTVLLAVMAGLTVTAQRVSLDFGSVSMKLAQPFSILSEIADLVATLSKSAVLLIASVNTALLWCAVAVIASIYFGFVGMGTVFYRITFAKT